MSSLEDALKALVVERDAVERRLHDLDAAIQALRRLVPDQAKGHSRVLQPRDRPETSMREWTDGGPGTKDLILRLFRTTDDVRRVDDIYQELLASGWTTSSERPRHMVASNLSKLALAGQLVKAGYGTYRRPEPLNADEELSVDERLESAWPAADEDEADPVVGPHGN